MSLLLILCVSVTAAAVGGLLGAVTARWLAWLRRGARVPPSWCVAGTGAVWAATAAGWSAGALPAPAVGLVLGLGWLTVTGSAVDVRVRRLPHALTLPSLPLVLVALVPLGGAAVLRGVVGALVLGAGHAAVRWCAPAAMGGGDVALATPVGAASAGVSWAAPVLVTVLAALVTALVGAGLRVGARAPAARAVPHGPSMLVACLATVAAAAAWTGTAGSG